MLIHGKAAVVAIKRTIVNNNFKQDDRLNDVKTKAQAIIKKQKELKNDIELDVAPDIEDLPF